uniref:Putative ixodes 10 kDa peptide protein n=1 Tax=Ixodes ricinus TaxID=34613 RepID=A0A0K8RCB7_IXORI
MYRNISNMRLVLFAVVLILPAFHGDVLLSGSEPNFNCWHHVETAGTIFCNLHGSEGVSAYYPRSCGVLCQGNKPVRLPPAVCTPGTQPCSETARKALSDWKKDMEKTKENLIKYWCPCK